MADGGIVRSFQTELASLRAQLAASTARVAELERELAIEKALHEHTASEEHREHRNAMEWMDIAEGARADLSTALAMLRKAGENRLRCYCRRVVDGDRFRLVFEGEGKCDLHDFLRAHPQGETVT